MIRWYGGCAASFFFSFHELLHLCFFLFVGHLVEFGRPCLIIHVFLHHGIHPWHLVPVAVHHFSCCLHGGGFGFFFTHLRYFIYTAHSAYDWVTVNLGGCQFAHTLITLLFIKLLYLIPIKQIELLLGAFYFVVERFVVRCEFCKITGVLISAKTARNCFRYSGRNWWRS